MYKPQQQRFLLHAKRIVLNVMKCDTINSQTIFTISPQANQRNQQQSLLQLSQQQHYQHHHHHHHHQQQQQQQQQQQHHHHYKSKKLLTVESTVLTNGMLLLNYSKFTAGREHLPLGTHPLCEERAFDLITNLKEAELASIKLAIKKYDALKQKESFEGALAAKRWRTKFDRLSKVPHLGEVDPTGSFCPFPDDWLKRKAVENANNPTQSDLWKIFIVNAVPFVGFGFLDNFTMIVAGDYIEHVFGTFMCISTMAAAGLGNTISDVLGIGSAHYVERGCEIMGLKSPDLTPIQMEMKSSRRSANLGRIFGITVGCLIGMFPLMFMNGNGKKDEKDTSKST